LAHQIKFCRPVCTQSRRLLSEIRQVRALSVISEFTDKARTCWFAAICLSQSEATLPDIALVSWTHHLVLQAAMSADRSTPVARNGPGEGPGLTQPVL
jgi:hypothetical protein